MGRHRVQGIIIKDDSMLFGYGCMDKKTGRMGHFFIGGGKEDDETPEEAMIRELEEETGLTGEIIFKFRRELEENHSSFLLDIGDGEAHLGYDPEEIDVEEDKKGLQKLKWISFSERGEFTHIDKEHLKLLIEELDARNITPRWYGKIKEIIRVL